MFFLIFIIYIDHLLNPNNLAFLGPVFEGSSQLQILSLASAHQGGPWAMPFKVDALGPLCIPPSVGVDLKQCPWQWMPLALSVYLHPSLPASICLAISTQLLKSRPTWDSGSQWGGAWTKPGWGGRGDNLLCVKESFSFQKLSIYHCMFYSESFMVPCLS